jgi:Domain of unknown function (DUF6475)
MAKSEFDSAVAVCVGILAETYGKAASAPMIEGYKMGLNGLSAEAVKAATASSMQRCKFMPTPAELREYAGEMKVEDRAERAWIAFDSALAKHSVYKSITFDDVVINATVRSLGGLAFIAEMDAEQYQFLRARFLKSYAALARSGVNGESCLPLIGHYDSVNLPAGYKEQELVKIETGLPMLPGAIAYEKPAANRLGFELPRLKKA